MKPKSYVLPKILSIFMALFPQMYANGGDYLDRFENVAEQLNRLMEENYDEQKTKNNTSCAPDTEEDEDNQLSEYEDFSESKKDFDYKKEMLRLSNAEHYIIFQKIVVPKNSTIFVKGDIHGDEKTIPALITALKNKQLMNKDLILADDAYIIFLGDYIDRGPNSLEVIRQVTELKQKNPKNVFLLRGNHETKLFLTGSKGKKDHNSIASQLKRLPSKYTANHQTHKAKIKRILLELQEAFSFMPQILFLGYEDEMQDQTHYTALLHGGIPAIPQFSNPIYQGAPEKISRDILQLTDSSDAIKKLLNNPSLEGLDIFELRLFANERNIMTYVSPYLWNDFLPTEDITQDQITVPNKKRGPQIWAVNKTDTLKWLKNISTAKNFVHFIIRGHQQSPRNLFEKQGQEGVALRWNGRVITLDYSPRVKGFRAKHDVSLVLKPNPKNKRQLFAIKILRLPLKKTIA